MHIIYEYHDIVVLNLHASNMNARIFLHLRTTTYMGIEDAILTKYHIAGDSENDHVR